MEIQTTSFSSVGGGAQPWWWEIPVARDIETKIQRKLSIKPTDLFQKAVSWQCGPGGLLVGHPEILDGGGGHFLIMHSERGLK